MNQPYDPLKAIQNAWVHFLLDFRAWFFPETEQTAEWKMRPLAQAIRSCPARMMDDSEAMIAEWRKNPNDTKTGATASMPVMLTATAMVDMPPEASQLVGTPYAVEAMIQGQIAQVRVVPKAIRAQIAFYATNPHDARAVCDQICTYATDDTRRKLDVEFSLGGDVKDKYKFIIFENTLYPSPAVGEALNLSIFTVDVTLVGYVPQVIGLGAQGENYIDHGYDQYGTPQRGEHDFKVIVQSDMYEQDNDNAHTRIKTDPNTGETTVERIDD